jgi:3-oxoadipate enol-lactonase
MAVPRPLVLLHPFPADATFWDRLRRELTGDGPIWTPEAPGFGSSAPRDGWTIADAADDVASLIAEHAPDGRADVMGLSMGGYTALALAVRHPERCRTLILADTRGDADDASARQGRADGIAAIRHGRIAAYLDGLLPRLVAPDTGDDVREELSRCARRQPAQALIGALTALAGRPDRRADLAGIDVPTLVVVGRDDIVTPPPLARALADAIPGARLAEIPESGHLSALEQPAAVARHVDAFRSTAPG